MKKSFANCSLCSYFNKEGRVCDTNSRTDITKVSVVYIIDGTDNWEIIKEKISENEKYFITSPILCSKTELDDIDTLNICKQNSFTFINKIKPNKIIKIGKLSSTLTFNMANEFSYLSIDEYFTEPKKEQQIQNIQSEEIIESNNSDLYMFSIPEKYYTDEYRLVDIQYISGQSRIIYIFRDSNNNKEYYEFPIKQNDFYWYESISSNNRIIESIDDLELKIGNYKNRCTTQKGYGCDINLPIVHSVDYYLQSKGEPKILKKNIIFFDIEVYTYKDKIFPDAAEAKYPINAISFRTDEDDDPTHIYLLNIKNEIDPRINDIINQKKYKTLNMFDTEYALICAAFDKIKSYNPDFISAWNSLYFDFPYLIHRMRKLNIPFTKLSPFGNVYSDSKGNTIITGLIPMDQLILYKTLTYTTLPSYSLDSVAKKEKVGSKVEYGDGIKDLSKLYREDIDTYISYSLTDTELLKGIEDATHHIALQDELRKITTNCHSTSSSTLGLAEGLFTSALKKKKLVSRNKAYDNKKEKLPGAYVFEAKGGLYDGLLCDFDFTSLYPSIINTWNISPDTFIGIISESDMFDLIYQKENLKNKKIKIIIDPIHNNKEESYTLDQLEEFISKNKAYLNIAGTIFKNVELYEGIYYSVIDPLFQGRKEYKRKMLEAKEQKNSLEENIFKGKQMAYKILANSLYGALANEHFRFYNNNLAKSITLTGQELLKYCSVHCDEFLIKRGNIENFKMNINFLDKVKSLTEVLYGDTDSMFCYLTDYMKEKNVDITIGEYNLVDEYGNNIISSVKKEVLDEIEKIQTFINEDALNPYLKFHNIEKDKSIIFLKNEYLFSKYYTLNGKKHYAASVISQEGKRILDTEVKGLEIRRSEIPEKSQELLTLVLDIILSDIPKDRIKRDVDKIVEEKRKEMITLLEERDNSIVRIVSYSKPLSQYKNFPQHIKAMQIWNMLMNEDFRYGSKGKLWNIKALDLLKAPQSVQDNYHNKFLKKFKASDLDCICVPEDVDALPPWFIPDKDKIIEYCCDDRISNLTEPLWRETDDIILF